MKWFEGGIPNAIHTAKDNKSMFIVFITGEDEASEQMESYLHQEEVTGMCERNRCVAVRLVSSGNDCKFFSQIFPVVVIPSVFFIGANGTPLEVIGECKSHQDFLAKVKSAIALQNESALGQPCGSREQEPGPQRTEEKDENVSNGAQYGAIGGASARADDEASPEKKAKTEELSVNERVERAKQLVLEKQEKKMEEEKEDTRRKENERRKVGQEVQRLKQNQKEMEMLEAKKEMRKDKEDDKIARQRVKEQIARDRAEKNARFSEAKQERDRALEQSRKQKLLEEQEATAARQAQRSDISRIQFRMPDGSSITNQFSATDTFATVYQFISGRVGTAITLSTSFPRRTFTEEDHNSTLRDLTLAPSAVILVIPGLRSSGGPGVTSARGTVGISNILFAPFIFLWNIIASLFGLSSGSSSSSSSSSSPSPTESAKGGDRNPGSSSGSSARQRDVSSRQQGAIHRFHNAEDDEDDEDKKTWNGNSTQQM